MDVMFAHQDLSRRVFGSDYSSWGKTYTKPIEIEFTLAQPKLTRYDPIYVPHLVSHHRSAPLSEQTRRD